jgi:hypothetical protein
MSLPRLLAAVLALACLLPAGAQASQDQFSIMMDDDLLVYRDDRVRDATLQRMKELDVKVVRVTVLWSVVAEGANDTKAQRKRFRRFGANNPAAYPKLKWDRYDRLVKAASTLGIRVYFNVTGPGPRWAHAKAPRSERRSAAAWKPKPRDFYAFVQAVGKRFSGQYRDENDEKGPDGKRLLLPRVSIWSIWNEPNQAGWLAPQSQKGKPASPHLFRELYDFGKRALISTGHGADSIFLGELAPLGKAPSSSRSPIAPKRFLREMFCLDGDGQPAAVDRSCAKAKWPVTGSAFAHHAYTKNRNPTQKDPDPDAITIANIGDLTAMLDDIAARTGRTTAGMPVVNAEFGFETNPPDPFSGVPLETQANWNTLGEFLAWQNPRVIGTTQFLLRDVKPDRRFRPNTKPYWFTYQSGLLTAGGTPKPALQAYSMPFLAYASGTEPTTGRPLINVWGALRFRPDGLPAGTDTAQIQFKPADGSADWATLTSIPVENVRGFYTGTLVTPGPGKLRAAWQGGQKPFAATSLETDVP